MDFCWISIKTEQQIGEFLLVWDEKTRNCVFSLNHLTSKDPNVLRLSSYFAVMRPTTLGILGFGEKSIKELAN